MSEITLTGLLEIDDADRAQRLAFLGIDAQTKRLLREAASAVRAAAGNIIEGFYDHLLGFEDTAAFLQDETVVVRLKRAQVDHLISMFEDDFDAAYFERRLRVGMVHAQIGLQPQWYIGGFRYQMSELIAVIGGAFGDDPPRARDCIAAFGKAATLEIELTIDAYIRSGFIERSLAEAHERAAARAQSALDERDQAEARKEELLRMVVHDVRSPVTAMISSARLGSRRFPHFDSSPGKEFRLIDESGAHVLEIIDNILTTARMTGGALPLRVEEFDAAALVGECVQELIGSAQASGHTLAGNDDSGPALVRQDPTLVRRIVSNLITNGIRHTPPGTAVDVWCQIEGERLVLCVSDDGPGIADGTVAKVLREEANDPLSGPGANLDSGLGLPFCRLATQRMGGTLRISRSRSGGALIRVELPRVGQAAPGVPA